MKIKNNAGFSLIELMVVVAIIGVLASIAVPSVTKYMGKARQTEAKSNLASYYVSQMAFFAEHNSFYDRFVGIGFSPEGNLRYNIGLSGLTRGLVVPSLVIPNPAPADWGAFNTVGYCGVNTTKCTVPNAPRLSGATVAVDGSTFLAQASGVLKSATTPDIWTINQNKTLTNTQSGI